MCMCCVCLCVCMCACACVDLNASHCVYVCSGCTRAFHVYLYVIKERLGGGLFGMVWGVHAGRGVRVRGAQARRRVGTIGWRWVPIGE